MSRRGGEGYAPGGKKMGRDGFETGEERTKTRRDVARRGVETIERATIE